jgi:hypothetical protein
MTPWRQYGVLDVPAHKLTKLDAVEHVETMIGLGKAYAKANLKPEHLAGFKGVRAGTDGHSSGQ